MSDLRVPDLNHLFVAGRLTRDPDLRYISGSHTPYCRISIANSRYFRDKNTGERKEETNFVDVTVWGAQAEFVGERLKKGRPVLVEGRLRTSEWEDQATGQRRSRLAVTAIRVTPLDWDDSGSYSGGSRSSAPSAPAAESDHDRAPREIEEPIPEDDIPF